MENRKGYQGKVSSQYTNNINSYWNGIKEAFRLKDRQKKSEIKLNIVGNNNTGSFW